jgi:predicted metal-dependent HD superfamily phosphohydrolase
MNLLKTSWRRAWSGVGASGDGASLLNHLLTRYAEPHRKYHTLQHLSECIAHFEAVATMPEHAGEVEIALWFHDAIYELRSSENEVQSADWARTELVAAGVQRDAAERVHALVLVTRHSALPVSADEQLLVDIDLSILGASAERFAEYEAQVRQEYRWVPDFVFCSKRKAILAEFLERKSIYSTCHFQALLESRARANLKCAVEQRGGT